MPRVAVIFFGLTRSLRSVYPNLKERLFDPLSAAGHTYDCFVHTYHLPNTYINPWSKERETNYDNDAWKIVNPRKVKIDVQSEIERKINTRQYCSRGGDWSGSAPNPKMLQYLVRNMVLALYSKKQATQLYMECRADYDFVIFTRPDQWLNTPFQPAWLQWLERTPIGTVLIPKEHGYHGINDRTCIARPRAAILYGNAYDHFLEWSRSHPVTSEIYMRDYLKKTGLRPVFIHWLTTLKRLTSIT